MYLPRQLISHLYLQLLRSHHPLSPPVLILVALEPDALCACRIFTALLKRDYIPHKIQPVAGYGDLARAGEELVKPMQTTNGGAGGVVVCLGVGGLVDLSEILRLSDPEDEVEDLGGVEVWVFDARRPWNLSNVFGGQPVVGQTPGENGGGARMNTRGVDKGCITPSYASGNGGIVVYDDGDIEEMGKEREAYSALLDMPEVDEDDGDIGGPESDDDDADQRSGSGTKKRKSWSGREDEDESDEDDGPPRQRRRSNSVRGLGIVGGLFRVLIILLGLIIRHFIPHSSTAQCARLLQLLTIRYSSLRFTLSSRTEAALGSFVEAATCTNETETRKCAADLLYVRNIILGAHIVYRLLSCIGAWPGGQ